MSFVWINTDERNTPRNCHSDLEIVIPSKARNLLFAGRVAQPSAPFAEAGAFGNARCTKMVYTGATMATAKRAHAKSARAKHVRRSVTLPPKIARQVETLARQRDLSDNRVLVELIEQGIEAQHQKEKAFFQLAERFRAASDPDQVKQLGDQLGRFVFGE